ncbi:MAG: ribosome-associated translation inhibitor RaiA [Pseudomonadota bacterium]
MSLRISGKHMNVGDTLTSRIEDRLEEAVSKYFPGGFQGHVTLEKQANRFACDCVIHLDSGIDLQGTATEIDPTAAFETAADKVEKRLRRYKRRLKDHHGNASKVERQMQQVAYSIVETPNEDQEVPEDYNPVIIAESLQSIESQSVAEAVIKLDMTENPVVVFTNAGSGKTNIVYRRSDGNIGWIDPSS